MNFFRKMIVGISIFLGAAGTALYFYVTDNSAPAQPDVAKAMSGQELQPCETNRDTLQELSALNDNKADSTAAPSSVPAVIETKILDQATAKHKAPVGPQSYPYNKPFLLGFQSQNQIVRLKDKELEISGCIPEWLYGSYVSVGPARFEAGKGTAHHWLDGLGMVHRFAFKKGHVSYANQFIHSYYYKESLAKGTLTNAALASDPNASYFAKLRAALSDSDNRPPYDNANIGIINHNNRWIALTETPYGIIIDRHTLKSDDEYVFTDDLKMHTMIAHPIIDPKTHELFGVGTTFGHKSTYTIFKMNPTSFEREIVAQMNTGYPSYLHSFALTDKSIILTQVPFVLNPYDLISTTKPFIENFTWKPRQKTAFSVFDRQSGTLIHTFYTDPLFVFHHLNGFQFGDIITLDVIAHKDPSMIAGYKMAQLFSGAPYNPPLGTIVRITLNLKTGEINEKALRNSRLEWPTINFDRIGMKPYHFVWALNAEKENDYYTTIEKYDITQQTYNSWSAPLCYPSQPTFVPKPESTQEDDGVILSIVLHAQTRTSFLLILDARTMKEIARINLPMHIPFIVHGTWMPHQKRSLPEFIKQEILHK